MVVSDLMFCFFVVDSETTEDEAAEPQIPLEAKEGARGFPDEGQRVHAGKWHFQMNYYVNSQPFKHSSVLKG